MLDVLLATMSFIAAMSIFFLCWLGWTLNEQLQQNDNVINELQDEIDMLRSRNDNKNAQIGILKTNINNLDTKIVDLEVKNNEIIENWKLDNKLVKMYQKEKLERDKIQ